MWYNTLLKVNSENSIIRTSFCIYRIYLTVTSFSASSVGTGLDYVGLRVIGQLIVKNVTCYVGHGLADAWVCVHLCAVSVQAVFDGGMYECRAVHMVRVMWDY